MSKLNPKVKGSSIDTSARLAGGQGAYAAKQDAEGLLRRAVLSCLLFEDLAYESGVDNAENIKNLIPKVAPEKVVAIAIEAREKQKLRHVPLYIAREMARLDGYKQHVGTLLPKIITRPDQITDFIGLYWREGKQPLSKQVKLGLARCFHNFSEYQFAKYDRDGGVKLRDALFLVHPKPEGEAEKVLFEKIANRTLTTPDTWEVALSTAGKNADKKAIWTRLIQERKLGALAFLRNLRNFQDAGVEYSVIRDGFNTAHSSMLLPINFIAAQKVAPQFTREIENLMFRIYSDLPKLPGHTVFVVDLSGSMRSAISGKSDLTRQEVANAMAMFAAEQSERITIYGTAGSDSARQHSTQRVSPYRGFGLISELDRLKGLLGGGGIFTRQCLEYIKEDLRGEIPDRIIIFSDSQDCDRPDLRTPNPFGKNNYICDVSAHSRGINYKGKFTAEVSGWSNEFLRFIAALEGIYTPTEEEQN